MCVCVLVLENAHRISLWSALFAVLCCRDGVRDDRVHVSVCPDSAEVPTG